MRIKKIKVCVFKKKQWVIFFTYFSYRDLVLQTNVKSTIDKAREQWGSFKANGNSKDTCLKPKRDC